MLGSRSWLDHAWFCCGMLLGGGLLFPATSSAQAVEVAWEAGVAKARITPEQRLKMAGYAARKEPAEGTDQELYAKVLVLRDTPQSVPFVVVTLDLIGVVESLRTRVEQELEKRWGVPPSSLLMNASHTHCGPEYGSEEATAYRVWLGDRVVRAVAEAMQSLAPAKLSYTHARCGFAMNRRTPSEAGYLNHPMPDGPVDPTVPVLRIESTDDQLRALMFGYACHNTTLGYLRWSGDYAGYAQQYLEEDHPGVVALFLMGCGGDQNPYPRRELRYAEAHGRTLATAVEAAIEEGQKTIRHRTYLHGPLQAILEMVELEYATSDRQPNPYPVQILKLGENFQLVALGSEATIDYALRLKRELGDSPQHPVWVAGYSNVYQGYIPSRRVLVEGGYEAKSRPWKPSLEGRIVTKVHELSRRLAGETLFQATPLTEVGSFTEGIEGPACDQRGQLYAVNWNRQQTIGWVRPDGSSQLFLDLPGESVGNGLRFDRRGHLYIADYVGHQVLIVDPSTKDLRVYAKDARMNQPNDLAIDEEGVLYASDPDWKAGTGQLWRIDLDGKTQRLAEGLGTTNGIDLSPDGRRLYVNESAQRKIWVYDLTSDKQLANKRLLREFADFGFDGMRVDVDGNLYVTRYGRGTVVKLSSEGDLLREIDVLGSKPSNICFGGPDGRTAYVTEVEHRRIVQFRIDRPGLEWQRLRHP
jgi:sugar lactone lactonase YvrE